jgi:hypothetical protein
MERLHIRVLPDTRAGRDCQFCRHADPNFENRHSMDKLVSYKQDDAAASHLTENGYVGHLMLEIEVRLGLPGFGLLPTTA